MTFVSANQAAAQVPPPPGPPPATASITLMHTAPASATSVEANVEVQMMIPTVHEYEMGGVRYRWTTWALGWAPSPSFPMSVTEDIIDLSSGLVAFKKYATDPLTVTRGFPHRVSYQVRLPVTGLYYTPYQHFTP